MRNHLGRIRVDEFLIANADLRSWVSKSCQVIITWSQSSPWSTIAGLVPHEPQVLPAVSRSSLLSHQPTLLHYHLPLPPLPPPPWLRSLLQVPAHQPTSRFHQQYWPLLSEGQIAKECFWRQGLVYGWSNAFNWQCPGSCQANWPALQSSHHCWLRCHM